MTWPTPQDYNEAVQNPQINFKDPELKTGILSVTPLGLPFVASGAFASVYRTLCGDRQFAIRCFLKEVPNQHVRYERISKYVMSDTLPYTVEFNYLAEGIFLGGRWYPILKMDWVQGTTLDTYVKDNLSKPDKLAALSEQFKTMMQDLQLAGIAHGDLQHGNIMVTPQDELRLVDYDGMFVPELKGFQSNEIGHRNYQHPNRNAVSFDAHVDNFSAWSIYSSLSSLSIDPSLANQLGGCDESLLFRQADYRNPLSSPVFALLEAHNDQAIRNKAKLLRSLLSLPVESIPCLSDSLQPPETLPPLQQSRPFFPAGEVEFSLSARSTLEPSAEIPETGHFWASLTEYVSAIASPSRNFIDPRMQQYVLLRDKDRSIHAEGTYHGAVFRFRKPDGNEALVKVFLKGDSLIRQRYELLRSHIHLNGDNLRLLGKHFVDFTFVSEGLKVGQKYYSVVTMDHMKLPTLFQAVEEDRRDRHKMKLLIQHFQELMAALEAGGIVHGDIEPGNILVDSNRLVLVDYDLTTTPLSRPLASTLLGNRHLQHPRSKHGGPELNDHFSAWLLYYTLKLIMLDPILWNMVGAKPGCLLFHADDLKHPHSSPIFSTLGSHFNDEVRHIATSVEQLCATPANEIQPLKFSFADHWIPAATPLLPHTALPAMNRPMSFFFLTFVFIFAALSNAPWLLFMFIPAFGVWLLMADGNNPLSSKKLTKKKPAGSQKLRKNKQKP